MTLVEKNTVMCLNELKIVAQLIYTRFCQANFFTGHLCEDIIIDMKDIHKDIVKFRKMGRMTIDYLLSNYGESISDKRERFESVIRICDLYLSRMNQVLLAAKHEVKDDNQLVIQKCDLTVEQGLEFIDALKELKADAVREVNIL